MIQTHSSALHHQHRYLKHKELSELYWSVFIKCLGDTLISIFTPIYLLTHGFSVDKVAWFMIISFFAVSVFLPLGLKLDQILGIKKTLGLGTLGFAVYYLLLTQIQHGVPFALVAVMWGLSVALYFAAYNVELTKTLKRNREASSLSFLQILNIFAGIIGPLIGALIISNASYAWLFIVVATFYVASVFPLFFSKDFKLEPQQPTIKSIRKADTPNKALGYLVTGAISAVSSVIWPIFIYQNYKNIVALGAIISATSILMIVFLYVVGKSTDKSARRSFKVGALTHAPTWILRLFLISPTGLALSNFAGTATYALMEVPFNKSVFHKAMDAKELGSYFLFREFILEGGRIMALILPILGFSFISIFLGASVLSLLQLANTSVISSPRRPKELGSNEQL